MATKPAPKYTKREKTDMAFDKKMGIKPGSPKDKIIDHAVGVKDDTKMKAAKKRGK